MITLKISFRHQLLQNFHTDIKRAQNSYFKKRYLIKRFDTILWKTLSVLNFLATRETIPMILKLFIHFDNQCELFIFETKIEMNSMPMLGMP